MEYYIHFRSRDGLKHEQEIADREFAKYRIHRLMKPEASNGLKSSKDLKEGFDQVDERTYRQVKVREIIIYEYEEI